MKKVSGLKFLLLALGAFIGVGIDALYVSLLWPAIYNAPMSEWSIIQNIICWTITCVTWVIIAVILIKVSKQRYGFDLFEYKGDMKGWQLISITACIIAVIVVSYFDWNGFKVIKEFQYHGWLKFIFQYIYYICETMLFTLIIIFGQKACELWFKKENFPYGGIAVALTWGIAHILTKGSLATGVLSALGGFVFGAVYLLVNRDIKKAFPILLIMFVM